MIIGFDAKKAAKNYTGIGNYSRRCIKALSEYSPENALVLFAPKDGKAWGNLLLSDNIIKLCPFKGIFYEIWRNLFLPHIIRRKNIDIYHGLSNELPIGMSKSHSKSVVTIHDLIFLRHPETYKWTARKILQFKTRYACKSADHIITVSKRTKDDIIELYHIDKNKITVVYQSINPVFFDVVSSEDMERCKRKYMLPAKYLLCVGTIEKRKNQEVIIKALTELDDSIHAVLVGKKTTYQDELLDITRNVEVQNRVHILNHVSSDELPSFYQMASVFCLMSVYEGFGIPVAEAIASGVPVIAASGSCLEEAGGPDSIYGDACDHHALAVSIKKVMDNPQFKRLMIEKGKEYARQFDDRMQAKQIMEIYQSLKRTQ